MDVRNIGLTSILASLYTAAVVVLAPISFGPIQLRLADCLIPLSAIFGWPAIAGATLGCFMGNAYFSLGIHDVIFGPIANLIAGAIIFMLRRRPLLACMVGSVPIGLIVGSYLWIYFPPPEIFGVDMPVWLAMVVSITVSSLIAVAGLGYVLLRSMSVPSVVRPLRSRGMRVYKED